MDEQLTDENSLPLPKDNAELVRRIEAARASLRKAIGRLSEAQLVAAGPYEGWSVKDHLAHLAAWEAGIAALLRHEPRYPAMGLDGPLAEDIDATKAVQEQRKGLSDALNAIIHARTKDRSLADVQAYLRHAQRSLLDALGSLSDADLLKTYSHYQPDEPGEDSGEPIVRWIAGNTYEHYAEHQEWIEALVGQVET